jgi:hypothetical protein
MMWMCTLISSSLSLNLSSLISPIISLRIVACIMRVRCIRSSMMINGVITSPKMMLIHLLDSGDARRIVWKILTVSYHARMNSSVGMMRLRRYSIGKMDRNEKENESLVEGN